MTRSSSAQSVGAVLNNGQNVSPEQDQRCSHPELLMQLQSTRLKVRLLEDENTELKAVFKQQEIERKEKARIDTEKEASKQQEDTAHNTRITIETVMKVFDKSLASYKRKEDLIVIAGALGLPIDGTVKALIERIKSHLQGHKELADNPQFSGLFGHRVQAPEGSSHSGQSSQSPLYSSVNSSTAFSPQSVQTPYFLATQSQFPDPTFYNGFSGPGCSTPGPSYNFNISERVLPPPTDENGVIITYYNELGQPYYVL
ncbi:hypothetical protein SERLADRAFT_409890 [Serpula lacrymans var. lacrymans S7.9]|uniref:Uncharacterized protein n=1 Tax=Serpula lacrymans var. lacrymans (strain S7.9) TaxID=578457 RepID=F8P2I3_SERL9|nr:uncharacterized protein SERLADRAFT_409890 [Serpula lacrymans var. lacrymans S7.9]EGO22368.1 hypothetical protein SERLADRAFT_409890 [Serpula lacrymans var. lacrymans S7.9]